MLVEVMKVQEHPQMVQFDGVLVMLVWLVMLQFVKVIESSPVLRSSKQMVHFDDVFTIAGNVG